MDTQEAAPAEGNRRRRRPERNGARQQPAAPTLRPYQVEAQQAILEARARGIRSQIVSLATGLGKTVVIATLPKLFSLRPGDVTLVVAHRDELIEQTVEKLHAENPEAKIGVEKAERRAPDDSNIVVATVQTLADNRLEVVRRNAFTGASRCSSSTKRTTRRRRRIARSSTRSSRSAPKRWCSGSPRRRTAATACG